MKTTINRVKEMTIEEFADAHGLEMEVHERAKPSNDDMRFYARLRDSEIREPNVLVGVSGNGSTPEFAIVDYAKQISLKELVIGGRTPGEYSIFVPRLVAPLSRPAQQCGFSLEPHAR